MESLSQIIGQVPLSNDLKIDDNILIQNHREDYTKLIAQTDKLIEKSSNEIKFTQISSDNVKIGILSTDTAISFSTILIIIIIIIVYKRFFHLNTWLTLAQKLGNNTERIPKFFVRNIYHNRPGMIHEPQIDEQNV